MKRHPLTTTIGSYPVFPRHEDIEYYERMKSRGVDDVLDPFVWSTEEAVRDFFSSGIEVVSSGQTRGDLYSLFLDPAFVKGVVWEGSEAYVKKRIERLSSARAADVRVARDALPKQFEIKEPITDAYTLAKFLKLTTSTYRNVRELAIDVNRRIVIPEIEDLQKEGLVSYIQLDSPQISAESSPADYFVELYENIMSVAKVPVVLHACGDTVRVFGMLAKTGVDVLSLDFYHYPKLMDEVGRRSFDQSLGIGALDAQSPRVESVAEVSRVLERARRLVGDRVKFVHPHCGQRSLDRWVAREKNSVLTIARNDVFFGEARQASLSRTPTVGVESGYFLVQTKWETKEIIATYYSMDHSVLRRYRSVKAEAILQSFNEDARRLGIDRGRLSYLALELGRAEAALGREQHSRSG
ncbi:MAG: hypothetical protein JRN68_10835 [Nitrososphaerota archaeon]|nr:hypothetical protein [Nitrososphaerota archaeon]